MGADPRPGAGDPPPDHQLPAVARTPGRGSPRRYRRGRLHSGPPRRSTGRAESGLGGASPRGGGLVPDPAPGFRKPARRRGQRGAPGWDRPDCRRVSMGRRLLRPVLMFLPCDQAAPGLDPELPPPLGGLPGCPAARLFLPLRLLLASLREPRLERGPLFTVERALMVCEVDRRGLLPKVQVVLVAVPVSTKGVEMRRPREIEEPLL